MKSAAVIDLVLWRRAHPQRAQAIDCATARARCASLPLLLPAAAELVRLQACLWCAGLAVFWLCLACAFRGGHP